MQATVRVACGQYQRASASRRTAWLVAASVSSALLCGLAGPAHAQKVLLLPLPTDTAADSSAKIAHTAVTDALGMQGLQVIAWETATAKLPPAERDQCRDIAACTTQRMRTAGAELAAGVVIARSAQGVAERVRVALLDDDRGRYDGEAVVDKGDVRNAATRALLEARSYQLLGPGPWIRVEGTPEGAEVLLDDRVVGQLPYRGSIAAGLHSLRVREAGYTTFQQPLDVPATNTHRADVVVALEPAPIALSKASQSDELRAFEPEPKARSERGSEWLVWPSIVGGAGVVIAGVTSARLITGIDDCVKPDLDRLCMERRSIRWVPTVLAYSVSAALIGTAIVWIVAGSNEETPRLEARVGLGDVAITGSF